MRSLLYFSNEILVEYKKAGVQLIDNCVLCPRMLDGIPQALLGSENELTIRSMNGVADTYEQEVCVTRVRR